MKPKFLTSKKADLKPIVIFLIMIATLIIVLTIYSVITGKFPGLLRIFDTLI